MDKKDHVILDFGNKKWRMWRSLNNIHRARGPAVESDDGTKQWWEHGSFKRCEKPGKGVSRG